VRQPVACKLCRESAAFCAWLAAVKIARLSSWRTVNQLTGQSVDLLAVENRVSLHKGNFDLHGCAFVVGAFLREFVGIDDQRPRSPLRTWPPSSEACV
jgi:hypothetical protein